MDQRTKQALTRIMQKTAAGEQAMPPQEQMPPQDAQIPPEAPAAQQAAPQGEAGQEGDPLLAALIAAYCAEKVSEYQYEYAVNAGLGAARNYFLSECTEHRKEEHDHADLLATRIDELGGTIPFTLPEVSAGNPAGDPQQVENNRDTGVLTQQIIEAEQQAVQIYTEIEEMTRESDPVTNDMIIGILATEQKHVVDMSKIMMTIGM